MSRPTIRNLIGVIALELVYVALAALLVAEPELLAVGAWIFIFSVAAVAAWQIEHRPANPPDQPISENRISD
jgi:hypothetical protein